MIRATILTKQCSIRSQYSTSVSLSSRNMSGLFLLRSSMTENSKHKNASFTFVWALLNKCRILEQQEIQEVDIFCFSHMETSSELLRVVVFRKNFARSYTRANTPCLSNKHNPRATCLLAMSREVCTDLSCFGFLNKFLVPILSL